MFKKFGRIFAAAILSLTATAASAVTFTQINTIAPGEVALFDVDLELEAGYNLGRFSLGLTPSVGTAFVGVTDNPFSPNPGSSAPAYQLISFADPAAPVEVATGAGSASFTSTMPIQIIGTNTNFPVDNLSQFRIAFVTANGVPDDWTTEIGFASVLSVQDSLSGSISDNAFPASGSFSLRVGAAPAVVPLPATSSFMVGGLLAFAWVRRQKSTT